MTHTYIQAHIRLSSQVSSQLKTTRIHFPPRTVPYIFTHTYLGPTRTHALTYTPPGTHPHPLTRRPNTPPPPQFHMPVLALPSVHTKAPSPHGTTRPSHPPFPNHHLNTINNRPVSQHTRTTNGPFQKSHLSSYSFLPPSLAPTWSCNFVYVHVYVYICMYVCVCVCMTLTLHRGGWVLVGVFQQKETPMLGEAGLRS